MEGKEIELMRALYSFETFDYGRVRLRERETERDIEVNISTCIGYGLRAIEREKLKIQQYLA